MAKTRNVNIHIIALYLFLVLISIGIITRIVDVQKFTTKINTNSQPKYFKVKAPRGNIMADDGSLLAVSMPLYDIRLDMSVIDDQLFNEKVKELSNSLSRLFNDENSEYYELFLRSAKNKKRNKYVLLKNRVTHNQLKLLKSMPIFELGKNTGGLIPEQRPNRENPFGLLAQRTIGVLRNVNPVGIERAFNKDLSGIDGKQLKRKIAKGIWVPQDSDGDKMPVAGDDVITTINVDMQDVAEVALSKTLLHHDADWGCVVLMEVETGEIKVIANLKRQKDGSFKELFNYALAKHVSPGSTFKLASIIAGLEDGVFSIEDSVKTYGGRYTFYDRIMKDSQLDQYDIISISDAFVSSSNVGISRVIFNNYKNNPENFTDRIYKMGLSTPLKLELAFPNNLKSPEPNKGSWSGVTLPWMSIGYEMQLTPIHMLTFYNAIANKGKMVKPRFTSGIMRDGEIIDDFLTEIINPSICSERTIDIVTPLLIDVVENGTAKSIYTDRYMIAGKTGTTVINFNKRLDGELKQYQASFAGFFPADYPKYSCIVVINNPKINGHYGGAVAAPLFRELADKVFASDMSIHNSFNEKDYKKSIPDIKNGFTKSAKIVLDELNIESIITDLDWMVCLGLNDKLNLQARKIEEDFQRKMMPDLTGMGISDALYLLEKYGLNVEVKGSGEIISQSIKKGELFNKGSVIKIKLS